jgi:hypothetical protein
MKKIECYQSSDEEFTGTKAEVLEYELNQAKRTVINRFCGVCFSPKVNTREEIEDHLMNNVETIVASIKTEQRIIEQSAESL